MRRIATLLLLLLCAGPALAKECGEPGQRHWRTVLRWPSGTIGLRWTGVYLGHQSVCELSYRDTAGHRRTLEVWGQPVPDEPERLIAFSTCRDRGCDPTILVADLNRGVLMRGELPVPKQKTFFSMKWSGAGRTLGVEVESTDDLPPGEFICWVTETVTCGLRRGE
jgi:hypothetical protein